MQDLLEKVFSTESSQVPLDMKPSLSCTMLSQAELRIIVANLSGWKVRSWQRYTKPESQSYNVEKNMEAHGSYPLVNVYITMENHHFQWVNPL